MKRTLEDTKLEDEVKKPKYIKHQQKEVRREKKNLNCLMAVINSYCRDTVFPSVGSFLRLTSLPCYWSMRVGQQYLVLCVPGP